MISLAKLSIFSFVLWSWQYPNYVNEQGTSWGNGTSQNETLGVRISRSLGGEIYKATAQQNKISGNRSEGFRKNNELGKMPGRLDSRVQSRRSPNTKNKPQREKIGIKCKGISDRVAYSRHKKKSFLFYVLAFLIPYPLSLYCISLMVAFAKNVQYSLMIWSIGTPAFIGLVCLCVFLGFYHPLKWFNIIK